ncbi:MAG: hypothetical protein FJ137_23320 [Deltaproteobacteria bacterium]|nr:hypothetical protein [Deltaproteobacteria bacterium]
MSTSLRRSCSIVIRSRRPSSDWWCRRTTAGTRPNGIAPGRRSARGRTVTSQRPRSSTSSSQYSASSSSYSSSSSSPSPSSSSTSSSDSSS